MLVLVYNEFARTGLSEAVKIGHIDDQPVALFILSLLAMFSLFKTRWAVFGATLFKDRLTFFQLPNPYLDTKYVLVVLVVPGKCRSLIPW